MSTVKQLQDAIAARDVIAARKVTRDSGFGAATKKQNQLVAANSAIAAALKNIPDSPAKYEWAKKLDVAVSNDSLGIWREWRQNGGHIPQEAAASILRNYQLTAMNEAGASSARWVDALAKYNARQPYDVRLKYVFDRLNSYFRQGQALPGVLTQKTVIDALRQWQIDAQPGGIDKAIKIAAVIGIGAIGYGIIAPMLSSAGPVVAASAPSGGTLATSATIGASSAAVPGITVAGVGTGYSTGVAAFDTVLGTIGTGATTGAVASGVSGGSVTEGAKAGAKSGAVSGTVGAVKPLLPSVSLNLPKIDLPGSSGGSIVDDIVKNAVQGVTLPKVALPAYAQPEAQNVVQGSAQLSAGLDWKKIVGIVGGVIGAVSIVKSLA